MQKSDSVQIVKVRRQVQPSATLNRKYVQRPLPKNDSQRISVNSTKTVTTTPAKAPEISTPIIKHFGATTVKPAQPVSKSSVPVSLAPKVSTAPTVKAAAPTVTIAKPAIAAKPATKPVAATKPVVAAKPAAAKAAPADKPSSVELKELAIKKALRTASKDPEPAARPHKLHFGFGRILLAFACTAAAIFALVYFVNLNVFNLSIVNAAKEAGLEIAGSPKVPAGFELTDIVSEEGKLTLNYSNSSAKASFTIVEERSSWDSNALLTNYIKPTYGDDFSIVRENGLTIYISNSNAAWVSGRIVHKIVTTSGSLTKKQIRAIATSL